MDKLKLLTDTTKETVLELLEKMNELASEGNLKKAKILYAQVQIIIAELNNFYKDNIEEIIEEEYVRGYDLEDMDFSFLKDIDLNTAIDDETFSGLHLEAIDSLSNSLYENLTQAISSLSIRVGRMAKDRFAEITRKQALKGMLKGSTRKEISKDVVQELTKEGITAFTDKAGRRWRLDAYAEMNIRSTLREAHTRGMENRSIQEGYDLVIVSSHGITCEKCAKIESRVFSLSGANPNYPRWDNHIIKHTHPNCRHTISVFQEKYYDGDINKLRAYSFSQRDNRTPAQKKAYNDMQEKKRKQRENKLHYERYKARLGDEAPKSLSGFIQMKKANSKKYQGLKKEYRLRGN